MWKHTSSFKLCTDVITHSDAPLYEQVKYYLWLGGFKLRTHLNDVTSSSQMLESCRRAADGQQGHCILI